MLTRQDILLINAALQFWAEEMDPENTQMLKLYAGVPAADQVWMPDEIQRLRKQLSSARLKYAVTNASGTELLTTELFSTPQAADQAKTVATAQVGTLLLPDTTEQA
ncbi:hypothetical protein [Gimesia maris]|uniref:Uncharacterized protein n=1 Tax=Gimesia maris TaxID=122 RepID=A0ABX5YNR6_9PLAN|nr:hypothetical protein [Gimesia maris]EDL62286.1 hypothetical protein PM8797T_28199 [Gimesia maris DSM 8797]QEG17313.1 hypothetical protein GmarT_31930 [Gimesia maris]QGQ29592.1 hypothetical protein F1729_13545 [Gimesia maris]